MNDAVKHPTEENLLDSSREDQLYLFAERFDISPLAVKSAIRACCSNNIEQVARYLESRYQSQCAAS